MRILCLQHAPHEGPAAFADWARRRGHDLRVVRVWREPLPSSRDFDLVLSMGGPMSANDEDSLPWIAAEIALMREAISAGRRLLGICLGAQLIARTLGGAVRPSAHKEIGWWPILPAAGGEGSALWRTAPETAVVLHWHGETFDVPAGGTRLAASAACPNQAFEWGPRVLALQFHLEATRPLIASWLRQGAEEMAAARGPWVQAAADLRQGAELHARICRRWLWNLMASWAEAGSCRALAGGSRRRAKAPGSSRGGPT